MSGSVAYLDTSAFLKLIVVEPESDALADALGPWSSFASASLVRTEATRALRRSGHGELVGDARRLLGGLHLVRLDDPLLDRAGDLDPPTVGSLDAVHLAAALALGPDLGVLFTYDRRLWDAAAGQGLDCSAPG